MKRKRDDEGMDIVWQTPANPPEPQDYIFRNGRRHVRPYYFEFIAHVKNRWAGKTIVDLFAEEFKGRPYEYYVHPCGQYRKNTVVGILQAEHGLAPLFPVHRLDRLVSGLLILARNAPKADIFRQQIEGGLVQKQYIAKVAGEFPEDKQVVDANINYNAREGRSTVEIKDTAKGKAACTKFTRISSNGTYSIVLCEPITGRTHQIRVHLQYLGHPIANDMLYLSEQTVDRSSKGSSADRSVLALDACLISTLDEKVLNECEGDINGDFSVDPMCTNCPNLAPKGYDGHEEGLWLHCFQYSGPGWTYECPYPDWAKLS